MTRTRRRQRDPIATTQRTQTDVEENNTLNTTNAGNQLNIEDDDSSSDTEIVTPTKQTNSKIKQKPKIQIFKGLGDKVTIENWLKRFEMLAKFYNWSDSQKAIMLGNYLEDDALNWYIENYTEKDFSDMKSKLISRFGLETVEPIVEFVNLKYDIKTGIKEYFETKRRFGVAAKLTESQMIPLMVQGLQTKMVECFTAVKPKTFAEFYSIAKSAENNLKRNTFQKQTQSEVKFKSKSDQTHSQSKRKPPDACRICENLKIVFIGLMNAEIEANLKHKTIQTPNQ